MIIIFILTLIIFCIICQYLIETIKLISTYFNSVTIINENNHNFNYVDMIDDNSNQDDIWSKIILDNNTFKPIQYHLQIPNLTTDKYNIWKEIVSNIDFDTNNNLLIISTNDEIFALIVANLIIMTCLNQISFEDILNKQLITKTINKAKKYELVYIKIKDQIKENIYGKKVIKGVVDFEQDLSNISNTSQQNSDLESVEDYDTNNNLYNNRIFNLPSRDQNNKDLSNNIDFTLLNNDSIKPFDTSNYAFIE